MTRTTTRGHAGRTITCLAALALPLVGCGEDPKLGAVLPISGSTRVYGESVRNGIELAREELATDPDFAKLQFEMEDSQSDPEVAKEKLRKLFDNGSLAAIGGVTTAEAKAMLEVSDRYDRALLSPTASSPDLSGASRNFFRICPSDYAAASKMAQFAVETLNLDTVVVVAEQQDYAQGIQGVFREFYDKYGGEVLEVLETPPHTVDTSGFAERVLTLAPSAVYLAGYETTIGSLIRELRKRDFQGRILTTSAFATPSAIARVGDDAADVILTQSVFETDSEHAHVQSFVRRYREKYGTDPDIHAAHGYDAMKLLAEAIRGRKAFPSEALKGLREVQEFNGVTGAIQFDDKGDVRKFPRVYLIRKDLALYDYDEYIEKKKQEIIQKKKELEDRRRQLELEAAKLRES